MDFKHVDKKYRPIPFWSWNEKLDTGETRRQVGIMDEAGIGGYFMHARGGLLTEYMSDEWFDNVRAACDEGNKRGMHPWAYDENGWPSGFGGGKVNGLGEEYQQKTLYCEPLTEENRGAPNTVAEKNGYRYFYRINEFYVDTMSEKVIKRFIDEIYVEYKNRMGGSFRGFFTDEPQIMREGSYPWSFPMLDDFREKYGYDLVEHINELFFDEGDFERTRVDFWKLATELFSKNFFKQIYDFCCKHGYEFTGHLLLEEDLLGNMRSSGASMPHYEYFHIPGVDKLARDIPDCLTNVAIGSAAAQLGKKQVLSETFALSGHNVTHNDLKRIYEWQMVKGVNLLCTHLEGYSLRGIRKRDYPPAMYYQQPWWCDMNIFFDAMSRIGMLLAEGEVVADTLLLHNQSTAWRIYKGDTGPDKAAVREKISYYNSKLIENMKVLDRKHVLYHLGDEILMERHGKVENGQLVIGNMRYSRVVIPENLGFLPFTEKLLSELREAGGVITTAQEISPSPITEENGLTYTMRRFPEYDVHYFVNTHSECINATISRGDKRLIPETGETVPFFGSHKFAYGESLVLIDTHRPRERETESIPTTELSLLGEWKLKSATMNSLTLDRCDYYFDGELIAKQGYVLDILPRINELRRPVDLREVFTFDVKSVPKVIYLCTETPEIFTVTVNGKRIDNTPVGDFRDSSFKLLDISGAVTLGKNEIVFTSTVVQSEKTYEHLSKSWAFETMKNSLSYDMEIEQIYLVGDFGVGLPEIIEDTDIGYPITEQPYITDTPETVDISRLDMSGYPEFAGELVLTKTVDISDTHRHVRAVGLGMNSVHVTVNGTEAGVRMYAPYEIDISEYLHTGENTLEVKIVNNLRNMQGPYHMRDIDSGRVSPPSFFRESNVFAHGAGKGEDCHDVRGDFLETTSLVHFGIVE
ncbi:MAG: hypothetical protein IKD45_05850 [Clostridia bacterium]|nr:hypothetical protein [Clostridia bacterium]